jgi:hypothetical protein
MNNAVHRGGRRSPIHVDMPGDATLRAVGVATNVIAMNADPTDPAVDTVGTAMCDVSTKQLGS